MLFCALKNMTFSVMMLGRTTIIFSVPQKTLTYKFLHQWKNLFYDANDIVKVWVGLTKDCGLGENASLVDCLHAYYTKLGKRQCKIQPRKNTGHIGGKLLISQLH